MLLAVLYYQHHDALLADMYQFYHIDIRAYEEPDADRRFLAVLASQLPRGARVWASIDQDAEWSMAEWLLSSIDLSLRKYLYSFSEDAKHGINEPRPALPVNYEKEKKKPKKNGYEVAQMSIQDLRAIVEANIRGADGIV